MKFKEYGRLGCVFQRGLSLWQQGFSVNRQERCGVLFHGLRSRTYRTPEFFLGRPGCPMGGDPDVQGVETRVSTGTSPELYRERSGVLLVRIRIFTGTGW